MNIKPLPLVVPILLATSSVSAYEIYKSDNNSVELNGWAKAYGSYLHIDDEDSDENENQNTHVKTDAELALKATHEIDEQSKVIGSFLVGTEDSSVSDKKAAFEDIKLEYDHVTYGNISLGDTGSSFEAIEKAHSGEGDNFYAVAQGDVNGQGIRYKNTVNDLSFSINYETESDTKENERNYAASLEYKKDHCSAAVAYGSDGGSAYSVGVAADVTFGDWKLGAAFVSFNNAGSITINDNLKVTLDDTDNEGETYAVAATYTVGSVQVYGSAQRVEGKFEGEAIEANTLYVGVGYDFTKSINSYVVAQTASIDDSGSDGDAYQIMFGAKYSF